MARPIKYITQEARMAAKRQSQKNRLKRVKGKVWRLVVPAIAGHESGWTWQTPSIVSLRESAVDALTSKEGKRGLISYLVAVQRHAGSGLPHLDILMIYDRSVLNAPTRYDYLVKHGDLTRYRTVNAAILDYGRKQDPSPLGDLDTETVVMKARVRSDLYTMMQSAMLKAPFDFNPHEWLMAQGLTAEAVKTNVYKVIRMVKDRQAVECNRLLRAKPGIRQITRELIESRLSADELRKYDSWAGYQTIVDHINQIPLYGGRRPHKSKNLLVVGRPDTGKTSLALQIERHVAVYYKDVSNWFPSYRPDVYDMVLWNEFSLRGLAYPKLLNYLEGAKMDLEYKGGSVLKTDNQLVYMTSNLSLCDHIRERFKSAVNRSRAMRNLPARLTEVTIPDGYDLFVLKKLICSAT